MSTDSSWRRALPALETNALSLLASRIIAAVAATVVFAIAAHQLSAAEFGLVASTLAAGFLANSFVTFGTDTLVTREVAARHDDALGTARAALRLQLASATLLVALSIIAWGLGAPGLLVAQATTLIPLAVVTVAGAILRGRQQMVPLATSAAVGAVVSLTATIAGFALANRPIVPIVALGLGACVSATILAVAAGGSKLTPRTRMGRSAPHPLHLLVRSTAPFAVMVVLAAVGAQVGLLLVEFLTEEPTGGYGVAIRLTEAGRLVPAAVLGAFFPAMVDGVHHTRRYHQWLRVLTGYTVVAIVVLVATAGPINEVVFDNQPDGAALIRILAMSLIFTLARLSLSFSAIAEGHERRVANSALIGTIVLMGAGAALAMPWGARGIAVAHVAGIAAASLYLVVARHLSATPPSTSLVGVREPTPGNG